MNQDKLFCTYLPLSQATVNFVHFIDSSINRKVSPEKRMEFEESVKELGRFSNMEGQAKVHQEPIIIGGSVCLDLLWA